MTATARKAPAKKAAAPRKSPGLQESQNTQRITELEGQVKELTWYLAELSEFLRAQIAQAMSQQMAPLLQQQLEAQMSDRLKGGFGGLAQEMVQG